MHQEERGLHCWQPCACLSRDIQTMWNCTVQKWTKFHVTTPGGDHCYMWEVWIHTCSEARQYFTACSDFPFLFQYFLVNDLCQFIHINSILLTDYMSIFMDMCISIYRSLFYPIPFHWTFGYFLSFSLMNCSKYPCMFSFLGFLNISFGSTSHFFLHDLRHLLMKIYLLIYELSCWLNCEPTALDGKSVPLFLPITAWQRLWLYVPDTACLYPSDPQMWTGKHSTRTYGKMAEWWIPTDNTQPTIPNALFQQKN